MFAVCPRGGCTCILTAEQQQQHFNFLYNGVCTIARKCEPSRKSISSDPLILRFVSNTLNASEYALVCFSTRSYPMEIALLSSSESKYNLTLRGVGGRSRLDCVDEQVFCVSLARRACDWEMMQLFVGEPGSDLSVFQIVGGTAFSKDDLEEWARRAKQEQKFGPEDHQHSPNRPKDSGGWQGSGWWQRPSKAKKEHRTQTLHPQNPSCSVKRRLSKLSKRKRQLPLRLMQCLPKAPSRPVQRRSEAIKAEAIFGGRFSFPDRASWGADRLGRHPQHALDKHDSGHTGCKNPLPSACAATPIKSAFSG